MCDEIGLFDILIGNIFDEEALIEDVDEILFELCV